MKKVGPDKEQSMEKWIPHQVSPCRQSVRVVQAVRNFSAEPGVSHIGLGVTALNNMKVLRRAGIYAETWPIVAKGRRPHHFADALEKKIEQAQEDALLHDKVRISHVVVSSPSWIYPEAFHRFCLRFQDIEFVMLNHSGLAYLSIDRHGITNNRELLELQRVVHNFRVAANNTRVQNWIARTYGPCQLLPNLYDTHGFVEPYPTRRFRHGSVLRIGSFGAWRPWKNQLTAAEAALQLARQLGSPLELYVNSGRTEGPTGQRMAESRREIFNGLCDAKLIEVPWQKWPTFRKTVSTMHLQIHPSFDETFCVVVADGIAEGVPAVVSPSIEWTPRSWWSEPCDAGDMVKVGLGLLEDQYAVEDARKLLKDYVELGLTRWLGYLVDGKVERG